MEIDSSLATSTNSVSTIAKETGSQFEAEAEGQTHNLSLHLQGDHEYMNILHPDVDYSSDFDSDELTYVDE